MTKGLYNVVFILVLCISANKALAGKFSDFYKAQRLKAAGANEAAELKLFKTIMTKGEILHASASGDGGIQYFTVVYKGEIYTCRTMSGYMGCDAITGKL
jgi:hypothetical protein